MPPPGTAATPLPAPADPVKQLLDLLGTLGTGTTTSTTNTSGEASARADELMKSIQDSANPENLATLVQGILLKAKEGLGPNIAASIGSGNRTTSDSSLAIIQGNAQARATADSAAAILEAKNNANKLAVQLADTRLAASRTTRTRTGVSPTAKALGGLGVINQGARVKKLFSGDEPTKVSAPEQLGYTSEQLATLGGPEQLSGPGIDASSNVADVIPSSVSTGESIDFSLDGGSGNAFPFDPTIDSSPPATDIPTIDSSSGGSGSSTDSSGGDGGDSGGTGGGTGSTDPFAPTGPPEEDPSTFPWIICTELHKQERMPTRYYIYGARAFAKYPDYGKQAYYVWAIPCVRHLRKYPNSLFSRFLESIFNRRAEYLAAKEGLRGAKKSFIGFLVIITTYSLCWLISRFQFKWVDPIKELEKSNAN